MGTKRPWGSTLEISEESTTTCAGPSKKNCFSGPSALQDPAVSGASNTGKPVSAEPTDYTSWQASECQQQNHLIPTNERVILQSDDHNTAHSDTIFISLDDDDFGSENQMQSAEGARDAASAAMPPLVSLDTAEEALGISDTCSHKSSFDSCLGVIIFENFQLQDEFFNGKVAKNVHLEVNGTLVIIKDPESDTYGGLLDQSAARVVVGLIKDHNVELSASIKAPKRIEVLIYGCLKESDSVGDMLMEQDCFLQQPDWYDATRPYHNPQCIHRDGETETLWVYNESLLAQATDLNEHEKSKAAELLDSATGPSTFRSVKVSDILVTELKDHQKKALSMMIEKEAGCIRDAEFPSVWVETSKTDPSYARFYNTVTQRFVAQTPSFCYGGLLADDMGLGKTLTTLALITASLGDKNAHSGGTLIVCPMTTITGWQYQIEKHFKTGSLTYRIYHGSTRDHKTAALETADIVLTSYETLRAGLPHEEVERMELKRSRRSGLLHGINWHRVVLDEAHIVRNRTSKTFHAVKMLKARHRWCLTGTPIQNRLEDLGSLIEFLRIYPFDDPGVFRNTFLTPINDGYSIGWERLRSLIKAIALRRTKRALDADLNLPPRSERIHEVYLDDEENTLYDLVKRYFMRSVNSGESVMNTFQLILRLRQICNHGKDLLPQNLQAWLRMVSVFGDAIPPQLQRCEACDISLDGEDESSYYVFSCFHQICHACLENRAALNDGFDPICPLCNTNSISERAKDTGVDSTISPEIGSIQYRPSSKVKALLKNLRMAHQAAVVSSKPPTKSVVFSTWTGMLDLIGKALSVNGFTYERLDGSRSLAQRRSALENFRSNPDCSVLLASLGSAAVGLDLTMASHVHLMEPGWNPQLEQQAMDRVHRLGQESETVATRYIVVGQDSIEQYVRRRQMWKMNLISSSLDNSKAQVETISKDFMRTLCVKEM